MAQIFNKVRDFINQGDIDSATAIYSKASEKLAKPTHIEAVDILDGSNRYQKYLEKTQDFNKYYLTTGFPEVDNLIGGWDRTEELATIVARPGCSKTWCLLKSASAAAKLGLTVGLYSGEMTADKVGYRADTLLGHVSNRGLSLGDISIQNEYKKYLDDVRSQIKGKWYVITPKDLGHPATISDLRMFIEKYNLDALYVDQHSLLEDERGAKDPVTRAANISRDLKNLQVIKKIPIIAVSQQNRSAVDENAVIDVSHIAQADRIGQDSTTVIFLEKKENILTIHIAKSRDAVSGQKLKYALDLDKGIFSYLPVEDGSSSSECEDLRNEYEESNYGEDAF